MREWEWKTKYFDTTVKIVSTLQTSWKDIRSPQGFPDYSLRTIALTSKFFHVLYPKFQIQETADSDDRPPLHPNCQSNNVALSFRIILFTGP